MSVYNTWIECHAKIDLLEVYDIGKDLGHFWLDYIRMLGHLQMSDHLVNFERLPILKKYHLFGESKVLC